MHRTFAAGVGELYAPLHHAVALTEIDHSLEGSFIFIAV